jgi:hypothetical protein
MREINIISAAILASAVLLNSQTTPAPVTVTGSVTTGTSQISNDTNSSKMSEYRDPEQNVYSPRITFNAFQPGADWFVDSNGFNIGRGDTVAWGTWRPGRTVEDFDRLVQRAAQFQ